ncbi:hypothetical protein BO70DRAFT_392686 [Aspergillus heteromorphus CBS 117.55]|uniref:Uncharacterized protein n=1 Tax=Aspergillus heteromorphus CBS 117.55 TaxID=1448321 RepID=A0A317X385_9EURO|nr:uncharacterized protein BO70DRAFT_392686 [Aspergillus heteromorphus CBS 117.55]PWY91020.1 hypothetical protein BO70DRAFT_392686 [Aspergillus heteromorphus CBS 117.55]
MSSAAELLQLPAMVLRRAPRLTAGISQITNRPAIPGKLAAISHGKLRREAESQTPDLRRCLGHHNILRRCVKAAQEDDARFIKETYYDDEPDEDFTPPKRDSDFVHVRTQITNAVKAMVRNRSEAAEKAQADELVRMSARASEIPNRSKRRQRLSAMLGLKRKTFPHTAGHMQVQAVG